MKVQSVAFYFEVPPNPVLEKVRKDFKGKGGWEEVFDPSISQS